MISVRRSTRQCCRGAACSNLEQRPRIAAEDFCFGGGEIQAAQRSEYFLRLDPGMVAGEQQPVCAAEIDGETNRFGERRDKVHVNRAQILAGLALQILRTALEHGELMVHASADVRERAPQMGADQLQPGMLVELAVKTVQAFAIYSTCHMTKAEGCRSYVEATSCLCACADSKSLGI